MARAGGESLTSGIFLSLGSNTEGGRLNFISPWFDISIVCQCAGTCFYVAVSFRLASQNFASIMRNTDSCWYFHVHLARINLYSTAWLVCHCSLQWTMKDFLYIYILMTCLMSYFLKRDSFSHQRHHLQFFHFISFFISALIIPLLRSLWYSSTTVKMLVVFVAKSVLFGYYWMGYLKLQ